MERLDKLHDDFQCSYLTIKHLKKKLKDHLRTNKFFKLVVLHSCVLYDKIRDKNTNAVPVIHYHQLSACKGCPFKLKLLNF